MQKAHELKVIFPMKENEARESVESRRKELYRERLGTQ